MAAKITDFLRDEDGAITALSLQMFLATCAIGALAVDFGNGMSAQTRLQVAADATAHAALVTREFHAADASANEAVRIGALNMPWGKYGNVMTASDVHFGSWDRDTQVFTIDPDLKDAVMVQTHRTEANGNGVVTFLMRLAGRDQLDVNAGSVFETFYPTCFKEGLVAQDRVDIQSNNLFASGFCIHSEHYASFNSGNTFETGSVVSMPRLADVELPSSGLESNAGLAEALLAGQRQIKIIGRIKDIIAGINNPTDPLYGIMTPTSPYYRPFITDATVNPVKAKGKTNLDPGYFNAGQVNYLTCKNDNQHKTFADGFEIHDTVIISDCILTFSSGTVIEDSVIVSTNTDVAALNGSANIEIGRDDTCAEGGGATLITLGGVDFAAGLSLYGSQILAVGDVSIQANADGIEGASVVSGGELDVTSNGTFGFCGGDGTSNMYQAAYFRLAK